MNGKCQKCPDNPGLLVAAFIIGILVIAIVGYFLNSTEFNLAFISIGVDYFQVLALFAQSNIVWPDLIKDIFNLLSVFNFNIDITAPECLIPSIQYESKWFATMALPIGSASIFLLIHLWKVFQKFCVMGKRSRNQLNRHISSLVASFLVLFYYMYLNLTRKALDIFNCNPADPDDGYMYTDFTSINCAGGLCRCQEEGGVQQMLVPFAIAAFIFYSIGYPVYVFYVVTRYKEEIKEDQLLRALGTGDSRLTNENAYDIRKRYHRLYYHYKPGKTYWVLIVVARKFCIASTGLLFRDNPGFQLAVLLLILFTFFCLQIKHSPFMSTSERQAVIKAHKDKAANIGDVTEKQRLTHLRLQNALKANESRAKKVRSKTKNDLRAGRWGDATDASNEATVITKTAAYFWDYNTVESCLLACSIFVCVGGVMFESDRFKDREDTSWQRDLITYFVISVISFSMLYFSVVLASELFSALTKQALPTWLLKSFGMKMDVSKGDGKEDYDEMGGDVEMSNIATAVGATVNPLLAVESANAKLKIKELDITKKKLEEKARQQELLELQLRKVKAGEARARRLLDVKGETGSVKLSRAIRPSSSRRRPKSTKVEYAPSSVVSSSYTGSVSSEVTVEEKMTL